MRVRKRKWVNPFLEQESQFLLRNTQNLKALAEHHRIFLEIGSGHGDFLCQMGKKYPNDIFVGYEKDKVCVARSIRKIEDYGLTNVFFANRMAENIEDVFESLKFDGLYLQFSDPWPKAKHYKRRLTYRTFLHAYEKLLKPNAFLYFKTDNLNLFEFTLEELPFSVFEPTCISRDFHKDIGSDIKTAYETKFMQEGLPIYHAFCKIKPESKQPDVPRTYGTPEVLRQLELVEE